MATKRSKITSAAQALAVSLALHGLVAAFFVAGAAVPEVEIDLETRTEFVDIELAPPAPAVFEPREQVASAVPEVPETAPETPEIPDEQTDDAVTVEADAGVPPADAGPDPRVGGDAGPLELDAGPGDAGPPDAGPGEPLVASQQPELDGGLPLEDGGLAAITDAGSIAAADPDAAPAQGPAGAQADFQPYLPAGDVVSVLLRLDRLRKTPWAAEAEAILEPMPDHQTIVGGRNLRAVDLFDSLFIASPDPRNLRATTLVASFARPAAEMQKLLDHAGQKVRWQPARGGPLGLRSGRSVFPGDDRVYLMPYSGWILLARPQYLGALKQSAPGMPMAPPAQLHGAPAWIDKIPAVADEAGADEGPFAVVTVQGIRGQVSLPALGGADQLAIPGRITAALELAPRGFLVRGTATFSGESEARGFVKQARETRDNLVGGFLGRRLLGRFNALNAVRGLSLKRNGATVAYTTSMSVADARAMLKAVATWSKEYFDAAPR